MKNFVKPFCGLILCAVLAISCSKKDQLSSPGETAKETLSSGSSIGLLSVSCVGDSIIGNCAAPSGGTWGAIDYDLTSPDRGAGQIQFTERFNSTLKVNSGYYAYLYDSSGVTACNVTRAQLENATAVTSGLVGYNNTGLGWYDYPTQTAPSPTANRIVIVTDASSAEDIPGADFVYAIKLTNIGYQAGSCSSGQFQGLLSFTVNEL